MERLRGVGQNCPLPYLEIETCYNHENCQECNSITVQYFGDVLCQKRTERPFECFASHSSLVVELDWLPIFCLYSTSLSFTFFVIFLTNRAAQMLILFTSEILSKLPQMRIPYKTEGRIPWLYRLQVFLLRKIWWWKFFWVSQRRIYRYIVQKDQTESMQLAKQWLVITLSPLLRYMMFSEPKKNSFSSLLVLSKWVDAEKLIIVFVFI